MTADTHDATQPPRVLLVEDHDLLRHLIVSVLEAQASVETSASVEEAIEKAKASTFDALIIDISLGPGGNGLDVLKALRQDARYRTTPMIACTMYSTASAKKRLLEAGFDAYIAKPFEEAELQELVARLTTPSRRTRTK